MTPLLDVQNISKAFGAHVLFENISFSIAEGQHVGLIAKNGTGKSTLLSLLSGKESVDSGSIIFRRDIKVGFLEQQPKFDPEESVLDACFNHQGDPDRILKAKQILTQLHITDLTQPMGQLSGGQQKRIALANVLITEPDLLILDEPTNHLDLEMIEWLEGYLQRGNKTLLMVLYLVMNGSGGRVASVIAYLALKALVAGGAWLLWRYMLTLKWEKLPARDLDTPQA